MIRITADSSQPSRLIVEGHLSGRAVDELRESCANRSAAMTVLDLSGVMFADRFAAVLLCELSGAGFVLVGCSGFIRQMLRETRQRPAQIDSEETRLIAGLRAGDDDSFEVAVRRYGGRMLAAAQRIVQNESDARDAVQDAFLSVFRSIRNFAGDAALSTWLHRIVVNAALMQIRSRRRRCEESIEQLLPRFDENGDWAEEAGAAAQVDDLQEGRERLALVRQCLDKLPDRYRTVLMLRDIEDLDTAQTARMLGATPTAVKVRLHRARQALKTLIERESASNLGVGSDAEASVCASA
jgi:RNA polymerase sigma-70 factor (ECF subfamily)